MHIYIYEWMNSSELTERNLGWCDDIVVERRNGRERERDVYWIKRGEVLYIVLANEREKECCIKKKQRRRLIYIKMIARGVADR